MTEMQAAIERIQLTLMKSWSEFRQGNAKQLDAAARDFTLIRLADVPEYNEHAENKYYMLIKPEQLADDWERDRIVNVIVAAGTPCFKAIVQRFIQKRLSIIQALDLRHIQKTLKHQAKPV